MNREAHGGIDKACYIFSENEYSYWKNIYPEIELNWGFFGENITISNFEESKLKIGDIFQIGEVKIQISQPRQPCWKQDYRFNSEMFSKRFIAHQKCGAYVRIIKEGFVSKNQKLILKETHKNSLSILQVFGLLYMAKDGEGYIEHALNDANLAESCRIELMKKWKK
jgi:MOSC domain-containing protein YiiM